MSVPVPYPENVELAAATVVVIRENEFRRRGYFDLIDLLADQPGFDISRLFASTYANVYQRGFRQENTERTLVMIDGDGKAERIGEALLQRERIGVLASRRARLAPLRWLFRCQLPEQWQDLVQRLLQRRRYIS